MTDCSTKEDAEIGKHLLLAIFKDANLAAAKVFVVQLLDSILQVRAMTILHHTTIRRINKKKLTL